MPCSRLLVMCDWFVFGPANQSFQAYGGSAILLIISPAVRLRCRSTFPTLRSSNPIQKWRFHWTFHADSLSLLVVNCFGKTLLDVLRPVLHSTTEEAFLHRKWLNNNSTTCAASCHRQKCLRKIPQTTKRIQYHGQHQPSNIQHWFSNPQHSSQCPKS